MKNFNSFGGPPACTSTDPLGVTTPLVEDHCCNEYKIIFPLVLTFIEAAGHSCYIRLAKNNS